MRVFISYHTPDGAQAKALKQAIEAAAPGAEVFFAPEKLRIGQFWMPQLGENIANADAFLLLMGDKLGPYQEIEYYAGFDRHAKDRGFPIVPVLMGKSAPGLWFLNQLHWIEAPEPCAEPALSRIVAALKGGVIEKGSELWRTVNPYRGLEALREQDAAFFFGREGETAAVLEAIAGGERRVITVVGNSGVGKSSLMEAGVEACLKRRQWPGGARPWPEALADSREWAFLTIRPGDDPIGALLGAFMNLWFPEATDPGRVRQREEWRVLLNDGKAGLSDLIETTQNRFSRELNLAPPRRIVLNINQSEELYALTPEALRAPFSALIAGGLKDNRLVALASLRSDQYGRLQDNRTLFDVSTRIDLPPLEAAELKTVLTEPAALLGARFESDELAGFIVAGARGQHGALPLLAFYVTGLWERMQKRGDGVIRLAEKSEVVDLARALAAQADRFLAKAPGDIDAIRRLFTLKLALVQEEGKPVRHRTPRAALDAEQWRLVEALAGPEWRLLVVGEDGKDGSAYAEVAHEVLLESWGTLNGWLAAERDFLVFRGRVERARRQYEAAGGAEKPEALLKGLNLIQAEQWLATRSRDIEGDDAAYIRASVEARDAELSRQARFRRRVQWGATIALLVLTATSVLAGWQWLRADREKAHAEEQKARAEAALQTAARTADALVFDIAQKFTDVTGVPKSLIDSILKRAKNLTDELSQGQELTPELKRNRAAALNEQSNTFLALGVTEEARKAAAESAQIMEELTKSDPGNAGWQRDLSVSYNKVAGVLEAQGNLGDALKAYRDSLAISERLAKADPGNAGAPYPPGSGTHQMLRSLWTGTLWPDTRT